MTSAKLIGDIKKGYNRNFQVEINLQDLNEVSIRDIIGKLEDMNWDFAWDLVKIIKNE